MQAIVMAAGKGTRLGDMTRETPKPLIPLGGKPLLKRQLDALLKTEGIDEIIVITGFNAEKIDDYVRSNYKDRNIRIVHNPDYDKGAIITLSKAEPYIKEGFLVINADHLFSSKAYKKVVDETGDILVCSFSNRKPYKDERKIKIHEDGTMELSKECEDYDYGYTGLVSVGSKHKEEYFKSIDEAIRQGDVHFHPDDLILRLSKEGVPIRLLDLSQYAFIEIDDLDDYRRAQANIVFLESEEKG